MRARAFPLHRNPDFVPVSLPDAIARPCRHHDNALVFHGFAIEFRNGITYQAMALAYEIENLSSISFKKTFTSNEEGDIKRRLKCKHIQPEKN